MQSTLQDNFTHCRKMHRLIVVCSFLMVGIQGQLVGDEWLDPTDMLNYDATTKTMRKPAETANYENVPTKRREYIQESNTVPCPDITECTKKVEILENEVQAHKKKITSASQKQSCSPVFRRYLTKLLKEVEKLGLPDEVSGSVHYDAEVRLSRQTVAEIRKIIDEDESWKTGALDESLSQILINFKHHDYEKWKWHFEDTFSVDLSTVVGVCSCVLIIVLIICSEMWSRVSWFVQFKRLFAVCFFISIVWNWLYLYKTAFAEHQNNIVKMESVNEKCTGVKIDWKDNLKEWFRSTWTLQDDPCKKYYEVLMVNPILLVPPNKAISMTITTFFTDPLKHVGQGISEFLRALLKDLPITLQIPVLLTIMLTILATMYGSAQAAIQHGLSRPLRGSSREPPLSIVQQPQAQELQDRAPDYQAGGDANRQSQVLQRLASRPEGVTAMRQRRPQNQQNHRSRIDVENLGYSDLSFSRDEHDGQQQQVEVEDDQQLHDAGETHTEIPARGTTREGRIEGKDKGKGDKSPQPGRDSKPETGTTERTSGQQGGEEACQTRVAEVAVDNKGSSTINVQMENIGSPTQETSPEF